MVVKARSGRAKALAARNDYEFAEMKKQREIERDYSQRSLLDKLGIKEDSKICIVGIKDDAFLEQFSERVKRLKNFKLKKNSDLVFYVANSKEELKKFRNLKSYLKSNGAIWVVSLKGKQAKIKNVDVIAAAKSAGLVDNKVVSFSETHTALKLVIPLAKR